ncbi:aminoglycoside 6-adenylyltransferase [Paenibacillus daejeonensis]|uniref:aminoglycoside 6-adenylyltransferase n=1 Tax=Paenibacillus daejeonensis TaxID=135193 RepID=UPI0003757C24|nr:aminoglycoside 6-adenylyltransferase [Paenibacillus daejeonensis]
MRSKEDMMDLWLGYAQQDERIRLVTLEGSRTNRNIASDAFQDYDLSFFVTDLSSFKADDAWLDAFGQRIMMQKPEDMELFPPELGNWFSYLMLFEDGNKVDLTLIPLEETEAYVEASDGLVEVLLDKDGRIDREIVPTDQRYWIEQPTARAFDDCCNEFWFVFTYVVKGLARGEILYAIDHLSGIARPNLLRMMAWRIGAERGYTFSVGKNYKFIDRYLPPEDWQTLLATYSQEGVPQMWEAQRTCCALFRKYSREVASALGYTYPDYDERVTGYMEGIYEKSNRRTE